MPHYLIETWRAAAPAPYSCPAFGSDRRPYLTPRHAPLHLSLHSLSGHMRICPGLVCHEQIANNAPAKCSCSMVKQTAAGGGGAGEEEQQQPPCQAPQSGNKCQMQTARRDQNICPTRVTHCAYPNPYPHPIPFLMLGKQVQCQAQLAKL